MGRKKNRTLTDAFDKLERDYLILKESLLKIERDAMTIKNRLKTATKPETKPETKLHKALSKFKTNQNTQPSLFEWEYLADVPHHHLATGNHE